MIELLTTIVKEWGVGAGLVAVIIALVYLLLRWAKDFINRVMNESKDREEKLRVIIDRYADALNKHTESATHFYNKTSTEHEHQSDDHEAFLGTLKTVISSMNDVTLALARINGYKHE